MMLQMEMFVMFTSFVVGVLLMIYSHFTLDVYPCIGQDGTGAGGVSSDILFDESCLLEKITTHYNKTTKYLSVEAIRSMNNRIILNYLRNIFLNTDKCAVVYYPLELDVTYTTKQMLEIVQYLQKQNYRITILMNPDITCVTRQCLWQIADYLTIKLTDSWFLYEHDEDLLVSLHEFVPDIYIEFGNTMIPYDVNPGKIGIYIPTTPIKWGTSNDNNEIIYVTNNTITDTLFTYQYVLCNTYTIRSKLINQLSNNIITSQIYTDPYPEFKVVTPAMTDYSRASFIKTLPENSIKRKIVMLGRIKNIVGKNEKHLLAIEAFKRVQKVDNRFYLIIVGYADDAGDQELIEKLKDATKDLQVTFHISVHRNKIEDILRQSHLLWHITGLTDDNNSIENNKKNLYINDQIGVTHLEAMSVGLIPIYYKLPSIEETIGIGCGVPILDIHDLVKETLRFALFDTEEYSQLSLICQENSFKYHSDIFHKELEQIIVDGTTNINFFTQHLPYLMKIDDNNESNNDGVTNTRYHYKYNKKCTAYVYIESPTYQSFFFIHNIISYIGTECYIIISVEKSMISIYENILFHDHIQIQPRDTNALSTNDYQTIILTKEFWKQFKTEYILLLNQESILFTNNINEYINYNYPFLAAPWCDDNYLVQNHVVSWNVGDGNSISLRRKSYMIKCINDNEIWDIYETTIKQHKQYFLLMSNSSDLFFNICINKYYKQKQLQDMEIIANKFAVTKPCSEKHLSSETKPLGGSGFWHYTNNYGNLFK